MRDMAENENTNLDSKISISELCFLIYWSLMLFAKAIGWYDGQIIYKIILVVAITFWLTKMVLTRFSILEYAVVIALMGLSIAIYAVSGEKGIVICMMTMLGVKNVDIKRLLRVGIVVWGGTFFLKFMYNLFFIENVQTFVQNKNLLGYVKRYYMGYSHPNVLHISFFFLTTLIICYYETALSIRTIVWLFATNVLLFLYSFSITGFGVTTLYLILSCFFRNHSLKKCEQYAFKCMFPGILLFSVLFPVIISKQWFEKADWLFNNRIALAKKYIQFENLSTLGNNLATITDKTNTMDNSFVFILITYGVLMFVLICGGYFFLINRLCKNQRTIWLVTTICLLVGGISEPFLFNTSFKNVSLVILGSYLFSFLAEIKETNLIRKSIFRDRNVEYYSITQWIINLFSKGKNVRGQKLVYCFGLLGFSLAVAIVGWRDFYVECLKNSDNSDSLFWMWFRLLYFEAIICTWIGLLLKKICLISQTIGGKE